MKYESVVFIGMAGVGKSTIGRRVAEHFGMGFVDLDGYIERKYMMPPQKIIDEYGERRMLEIERSEMFSMDLKGKVVSPGGSIIYHRDLMGYLKGESSLVYLKDSAQNIRARIGDASARGIIGAREKTFEQIYAEREPLYSEYADVTVDCGGKSEDQIVQEVLKHF